MSRTTKHDEGDRTASAGRRVGLAPLAVAASVGVLSAVTAPWAHAAGAAPGSAPPHGSTTAPAPAPALGLTETSGPALVGAPIDVVLTATNSTGAVEHHLSFVDVLPAGLSYVDGSTVTTSAPPNPTEPTLSVDAQSGTTTLVWPDSGDLGIGASRTTSFVLRSAAGPGVALSDQASVSGLAHLPGSAGTNVSETSASASTTIETQLFAINVGDVIEPDPTTGNIAAPPVAAAKATPAQTTESLSENLTVTSSPTVTGLDGSIDVYLPAGVTVGSCPPPPTNPPPPPPPGSAGPVDLGCQNPVLTETVGLTPAASGGVPQLPLGSGAVPYEQLHWLLPTLAPGVSVSLYFVVEVPVAPPFAALSSLIVATVTPRTVAAPVVPIANAAPAPAPVPTAPVPTAPAPTASPANSAPAAPSAVIAPVSIFDIHTFAEPAPTPPTPVVPVSPPSTAAPSSLRPAAGFGATSAGPVRSTPLSGPPLSATGSETSLHSAVIGASSDNSGTAAGAGPSPGGVGKDPFATNGGSSALGPSSQTAVATGPSGQSSLPLSQAPVSQDPISQLPSSAIAVDAPTTGSLPGTGTNLERSLGAAIFAVLVGLVVVVAERRDARRYRRRHRIATAER